MVSRTRFMERRAERRADRRRCRRRCQRLPTTGTLFLKQRRALSEKQCRIGVLREAPRSDYSGDGGGCNQEKKKRLALEGEHVVEFFLLFDFRVVALVLGAKQ